MRNSEYGGLGSLKPEHRFGRRIPYALRPLGIGSFSSPRSSQRMLTALGYASRPTPFTSARFYVGQLAHQSSR